MRPLNSQFIIHRFHNKLLRILIIHINNILIILNSHPLFHFTRSNYSAYAHEKPEWASWGDHHYWNEGKLFILKCEHGSTKSSEGWADEPPYEKPVEELSSHWCGLPEHSFLFSFPSCQWSIFFFFFFLFLNNGAESCETSESIRSHLKIPCVSTLYYVIIFKGVFVLHDGGAIYSRFALVLLHFIL